MAVSTESLQVSRVIVPSIPVNVVNVKLTDMDWFEVAVLAVIFFMDCVWVLPLVVALFVDSFAFVFATKRGGFAVSKFDSGWATD